MHKQESSRDTSHWQSQLERWGIKTNGYRIAKRQEYALRRSFTVAARKQREIDRIAVNLKGQPKTFPAGRLSHLQTQIERIQHVQAW